MKFSSYVLPLTLFKGLTGFEQSVAVTSHEIRQEAIYGVCFLTTKVFFHWAWESDEIYLESFRRFTIHCHLRGPSSWVCLCASWPLKLKIAQQLRYWHGRGRLEVENLWDKLRSLYVYFWSILPEWQCHSRCCYARPQTCSTVYAMIFARVQFDIFYFFFCSRSWLTSLVQSLSFFLNDRQRFRLCVVWLFLWTNVHVDMSIESGYSEFRRSANFHSNLVL